MPGPDGNLDKDSSKEKIIKIGENTTPFSGVIEEKSDTVAALIKFDRGYKNPVVQKGGLEDRLKKPLSTLEQIEALIGKAKAESLHLLLNETHTYKDLFNHLPLIKEILQLSDLHMTLIPSQGTQYAQEFKQIAYDYKLSDNKSGVTFVANREQLAKSENRIKTSHNKSKAFIDYSELKIIDIYLTSQLGPRDNIKEIGPMMQSVINDLLKGIISTLRNIRNNYLQSKE
ncbi:MAG: hypothetical protein GY828_04640 [Candidatus Gracilibacteria bacterium]|nr:hypothetical protein [Candidatus Gracilibacteria bacterium]